MPRFLPVVALCACIALAACSAGQDPEAGQSRLTTKTGATTAEEATAKESTAWPELADGKFTRDMCDVLTPEDFADVGRKVRSGPRDTEPIMAPNTVTCSTRPGNDSYLLNLQPDPDSARLFFAYERFSHDSFMQRAGMSGQYLKQDVVPDADESWFDADPLGGAEAPGSVLAVRKGSLLVMFSQRATGADAKGDAVELVSKILQRIPQATTLVTGQPHDLTLVVRGDKALTANVQYAADPLGTEPQSLNEVALPWKVDLQLPHLGLTGTAIRLSASAPDPADAELTCSVEVDDRALANEFRADDRLSGEPNTCVFTGTFTEAP